MILLSRPFSFLLRTAVLFPITIYFLLSSYKGLMFNCWKISDIYYIIFREKITPSVRPTIAPFSVQQGEARCFIILYKLLLLSKMYFSKILYMYAIRVSCADGRTTEAKRHRRFFSFIVIRDIAFCPLTCDSIRVLLVPATVEHRYWW